MPWLALAGLGLGMLKSGEEKRQADADRKLRAEEIRYSPWTKMQNFTQVKNPNYMGNMMSGGVAGLQMGQGMSKPGGGAGAPMGADPGVGQPTPMSMDAGMASSMSPYGDYMNQGMPRQPSLYGNRYSMQS